jgi:hemoglobin-like flavoprotein
MCRARAVLLGVLTNTWTHVQAGKSLNSAIDESAFRHAARSVKPEQYAKVGEVLVETLKGMAKKWTPEIEKAWVLVYNKVAAAMARPAVEFDKMVRPCVVCRVCCMRVRAVLCVELT